MRLIQAPYRITDELLELIEIEATIANVPVDVFVRSALVPDC